MSLTSPGPLLRPVPGTPRHPLVNPDRLASRPRADWLRSVNPRRARIRCGFTAVTIAKACGTVPSVIGEWEHGQGTPTGKAGASYCRIIAGLLRHLEVPEEGGPW